MEPCGSNADESEVRTAEGEGSRGRTPRYLPWRARGGGAAGESPHCGASAARRALPHSASCRARRERSPAANTCETDAGANVACEQSRCFKNLRIRGKLKCSLQVNKLNII